MENPADEIDSGKKKKKSKKRAAEPTVNIPGIGDYTIEYSKSSRAKCKVCEETILKVRCCSNFELFSCFDSICV